MVRNGFHPMSYSNKAKHNSQAVGESVILVEAAIGTTADKRDEQDVAAGNDIGVNATPTFYVIRSDGSVWKLRTLRQLAQFIH